MPADLTQVLAHYGLESDRDWGEQPVAAICHDDRHKSASVNWDQGLYNCHTCDWGGDHLTVIMRMEGVGYRDALHFAEKNFGGSGREVRANTDGGDYTIPRSKGHPKRGGRYVPTWKRG